MNRITQGPDGTIYAGYGRGVGNWGNGVAQALVYVFKPKPNASQFEIMKIRSLKDGYELYLSGKVDPSTVTAANFTVGQRNWVRQAAYGKGFMPKNSGNNDPTTGTPNFVDRPVTAVAVSTDSLRIRLVVPGIRRINQERRGDTVTHWHTRFLFSSNIKSATGETLYTKEADYAQNWIATREWEGDVLDPTSVFGRVAPMLERNVWLARTPGSLRVNVSNLSKPYDVVLRDLKGRAVFEKRDIPARETVTEIKAPGAQAVYTLEVRSAGESYSKVVTF